ncbi:eukaryotic peptide chain release factor GTP-binding subunit ERF3A-like protein isoform X1 [Tanacetum coccineum]
MAMALADHHGARADGAGHGTVGAKVFSMNVGDEGGFAPNIQENKGLELLKTAIAKTGYSGKEISCNSTSIIVKQSPKWHFGVTSIDQRDVVWLELKSGRLSFAEIMQETKFGMKGGDKWKEKCFTVDKCTIEKFEKEAKDKHRGSWYIAYIMDTNEDERVKGITVEVGRAHFEIETIRFTILDASIFYQYPKRNLLYSYRKGHGAKNILETGSKFYRHVSGESWDIVIDEETYYEWLEAVMMHGVFIEDEAE